MYRILVSAIPYDGGKSGISDYINSVVGFLIKQHRVDLVILEQDVELFPHRDERLRFIRVGKRLARPLLSMLWHALVLPFQMKRADYDFIFLPAGNRRLFLFNRLPTIVTFHDLSQYYVEGKYDPFRIFYIKRIIPFMLKRVDRIVAISENTRRDICRFYHIAEERVSVNYNGFNRELYSEALPGDRALLSKQLGLKKSYFLYIARIEHPGKNHLNLLKGYAMLPEAVKERYDLVLAGSLWNGGEVVKQYIEEMADRERVKLLGFVDSAYLPLLYREASLYLFPSFYEGFGIPLLEAMASGLPVLCADRSSLPEIGGEAVLTFNPDRPEEIKGAVMQVLESEELARRMVKLGLERVKMFDWQRHAERIVKLYEEGQQSS